MTPLTNREREIAQFVSGGLSDKEIAEKLHLSPRTVEWHVEQIRNKLGFSSRAQIAVFIAREERPPPPRQVLRPDLKLPRALCPVLVGREAELTQLEDALLGASRGDGNIALIAGEAGIGKTRLATELGRRAGTAGCTVLWGGCSEAQVTLPYLPFMEAIGNHLAMVDIAQLRARLGTDAAELAALFPRLDPAASRRASSVDSIQGKLGLFESVLALLTVLADEHAIVLVLEDLHWADGSTCELLDYLARRLRPQRTLLVGTYRSDEMQRGHPLLPTIHSWRRSGLGQVVNLQPLPLDGTGTMISAIFDERTRADTSALLHRRAEGNPFVLEELLKSALDRGDIFRTERGWDHKPLADIALPETVLESIRLRLERIDPEHLQVLRAAAVLGQVFELGILSAVAGGDQPTVEQALEDAVERQFLEETEDGTFRFRHALTREAIYLHGLGSAQRRRLHSAAADALAAWPGHRAVDLCQHLLAAGRFAEAVPAALAAAAEAEKAWAHADAASLYERLLGHVREGPQRGELLARLGHALWRATQPARASAFLEEAIALQEAAGNRRGAAGTRLVLARCHWEQARHEDCEREYQLAREVLEQLGPSSDLALAYIRLAQINQFDFRSDVALQLGTRAIEIARAAGDEELAMWGEIYVAAARSQLGDESAVDQLDGIYARAEAGGFDYIRSNSAFNRMIPACFSLRAASNLPLMARAQRVVERSGPHFPALGRGISYLFLGRNREAEAELAMARRIADERGYALFVLRADYLLAHVQTSLGRVPEALERLGPERPDLEQQEWMWHKVAELRCLVELGRCNDAIAARPDARRKARLSGTRGRWIATQVVRALVAAGRLDEAIAEAASIDGDESGAEYRWLMDGMIALTRGDLETAIAALRAAADRWSEAQYKEEEAEARLLLADALGRAGNREGAAAELQLVATDSEPRGGVLVRRKAREAASRLDILLEAPEPGGVVAAPAGERLVTVLFADVRGFVQLSRAAAPADMADRIGALHRWAKQEVERHRGHVDKFAGDAVMATFNISGTGVDHALQALEAALAIRDRASYIGLPAGLALATGPAIVSETAAGANLSVLGDTTNLASGLQAQARPGEILLSAETYRRVRQALDVSVQPERLELKGFEERVTAFRLTA